MSAAYLGIVLCISSLQCYSFKIQFTVQIDSWHDISVIHQSKIHKGVNIGDVKPNFHNTTHPTASIQLVLFISHPESYEHKHKMNHFHYVPKQQQQQWHIAKAHYF